MKHFYVYANSNFSIFNSIYQGDFRRKCVQALLKMQHIPYKECPRLHEPSRYIY